MDKQLKTSFIVIVKNQIELYNKLKILSIAEQKTLTTKEARGLEDIVKQKEILINAIKKQEDEKLVVFVKMAESFGLKYTPELKLQDLLSKAGSEDSVEIDKETTKLIILIKDIITLNVNNSRLMKNYLDFMKFTAELKAKIENPVQPIYNQDGIVKNAADKKSKIDQQI
ncbi:MAG: flagellar export chaperone FlgN [bacterium]